MTKPSSAPVTARNRPGVFIDFHRLVIDYPACHGVPTEEIFIAARHNRERQLARARRSEQLSNFGEPCLPRFYEPRGLKSLFDAILFMSRYTPDWSTIEAMARRGRFIGRTLFYRDLLAEISIDGTEGRFTRRNLTSAEQHVVGREADNMRSLMLPHLPDGFKLKLEMSL